MKKIISIILILGLVFSLFAGCAKEPAEVASSVRHGAEENEPADFAQGKTVAICMGSVNHPIHRVIQYGFLTKAEELGMKPIVSGLDEGSIVELINTWETDIANNNVAGMAIMAGDDSCYEMLKELKSQGIYTVVYRFDNHNYKDTKDFIDRKVAHTDEQFIRTGAEFIVDKLQERGIKSGTIGFTGAGIGAMEASIFRDIFADEINELKVNYSVTEECYEGAEITEATNKAIKLIDETPDMVAVFGTSGGSAQTWSTVTENMGITDLLVVCVDMTSMNLDIVEQGKIDALIYRPYYHSAVYAAESLYGLLNGEVYNLNEEDWFFEVEPQLILPDGEGMNGVDFYRKLIMDADAYFK